MTPAQGMPKNNESYTGTAPLQACFASLTRIVNGLIPTLTTEHGVAVTEWILDGMRILTRILSCDADWQGADADNARDDLIAYSKQPSLPDPLALSSCSRLSS